MKRLIEGDTREPVRFAHYSRSAVFSPYEAFGPNTLGEMLWPVTIEELDKGRVRVGFSYMPRSTPGGSQVKEVTPKELSKMVDLHTITEEELEKFLQENDLQVALFPEEDDA